MENMNISAVDVTANGTTASAPKHKWLAKGSKLSKKGFVK